MKILKILTAVLVISAISLSAYTHFLIKKMDKLEEMQSNATQQLETVNNNLFVAYK
ncbi:MAG: hypothetical protein ACPGLV_01055 [Bacteroidia bacterium]